MIELQSMSMQTIQKQMELTRVPPPPPPRQTTWASKTLLEILRDLGMKAMDSGYVRRRSRAKEHQELPEIRDAEVKPVQKARPTQSAQQAPCCRRRFAGSSEGPQKGGTSRGAEELRRVLNRMGQVDVARAFSSPENLRDLLTDIRKDSIREPGADCRGKSPASPSVRLRRLPGEDLEDRLTHRCHRATPPGSGPGAAGIDQALMQSRWDTAAVESSKAPPLVSRKAPPLSKDAPPLSSGKTPLPIASSRVSPVPSATLQPHPSDTEIAQAS